MGLRGEKTGRYEWDKKRQTFVKVSDRVSPKTGWEEADRPFKARVLDGFKRQEARGSRFAHKAKTVKALWA